MPADNGAAIETSGHAERMDQMYRYQRHIYDLTRKYYLFGRDRAIRRLDVPGDGRLLEVACGTGRNLLMAHKAYPEARLYGLDISAEMLTSAKASFRNKRQSPIFKVADATGFAPSEFREDDFERILISYALSMIPDWKKAIGAALSALSPGGSLHIVDFGQQEGLPRGFHTVLKAWLNRFHVTPRPDLRDELAAQAHARNATLEFESIGRGYAWHAIIRT